MTTTSEVGARFPAIVVTGYATHRFPQLEDAVVLTKPFTPESLARTVRETLDAWHTEHGSA